MNESDITKILGSIEKITLFLDATVGKHATNGIELLVREHPELHLVTGEIDVLIVTKPEDAPEADYEIGWIGSGTLRGTWAQDDKGHVIDPWLDERIRPNITGKMMEYLPVVIKPEKDIGPIGLHYCNGTRHDHDEDLDSFYEQYKAWIEGNEIAQMKPDRPRYLLGPNGVEPIKEMAIWAKVVFLVDCHDLPPSRIVKGFEKPVSNQRTSEPFKAPPLIEVEDRQAIVNEAITAINKPESLSVTKTVFATILGLALGFIAVQFL